MPEITEAQVRELLERCRRTPQCKSCMTEQGRNNILFTVFEREPLCSERIGSFIHQDYAWFFIEARNLLPALAQSWLEMAGEAERLRWIPVEERLPEATDGNYAGLILVFWDEWKMSTVTVQRMLQLQAEGGWNITHWMPLPSLPKEAAHD